MTASQCQQEKGALHKYSAYFTVFLFAISTSYQNLYTNTESEAKHINSHIQERLPMQMLLIRLHLRGLKKLYP